MLGRALLGIKCCHNPIKKSITAGQVLRGSAAGSVVLGLSSPLGDRKEEQSPGGQRGRRPQKAGATRPGAGTAQSEHR